METSPLSQVSSGLPDGNPKRPRALVWLLSAGLAGIGVVTYLVLSGAAASAAGTCGGG